MKVHTVHTCIHRVYCMIPLDGSSMYLERLPFRVTKNQKLDMTAWGFIQHSDMHPSSHLFARLCCCKKATIVLKGP